MNPLLGKKILKLFGWGRSCESIVRKKTMILFGLGRSCESIGEGDFDPFWMRKILWIHCWGRRLWSCLSEEDLVRSYGGRDDEHHNWEDWGMMKINFNCHRQRDRPAKHSFPQIICTWSRNSARFVSIPSFGPKSAYKTKFWVKMAISPKRHPRNSMKIHPRPL